MALDDNYAGIPDDIGGDEGYEDDYAEDDFEEGDEGEYEDDDAVEGDDEGELGDNPEDDAPKQKQSKFTAEQQKVIDKIVQSRLDRKDAQFVKQISAVAGTNLEMHEVTHSAKLWGLLKANPQLSEAVDALISAQLNSGRARELVNADLERQQTMEVKEAVLDLKLADRTFRKYADNIIEWADEQGYPVNSEKTLRLAYMAWKGSKEGVLATAKQQSEQRRKASKDAVRQRAGAQSGNSPKSYGRTDFTKMSDKDVLSRSGMKLFTDE